MKTLTTLLVANRGEIAVRVMRTAKAMGLRTVAVYSEADADALHVRVADQSVCIGPAPVGESYLQTAAILEAAAKTGLIVSTRAMVSCPKIRASLLLVKPLVSSSLVLRMPRLT